MSTCVDVQHTISFVQNKK